MNPNVQQQSSGGSRRITIYEEISARLAGQMTQGRVPWAKSGAAPNAPLELPRSAATGRPFNPLTVLILWDAAAAQGWCSQVWLTERQARALRGKRRKDQTATTAYYADNFVPKALREQARSTRDDPCYMPILKRFRLFNSEQCEGIEATPAPAADFGRGGAALLASIGASVPATHAEFAHLFCDLTHWTDHPARLDRNLAALFGDSAPLREDLIAELSSAYLCAHYGIVSRLCQPDHVPLWRDLLQQDRRAIIHAVTEARLAADFIIAAQAQESGRAA